MVHTNITFIPNLTFNDYSKKGQIMDISILRYLDILVGFAFVMALTSSFVTLLTQMVHSLEKTRSSLLEKGISSLLKRAAPSLTAYADEIAKAILQWHHVSGDTDSKRDVIVREQFIKIILEIVADPSPAGTENGMSQEAKTALASLFTDPTGQLDSSAYAAKLLESIDNTICTLETSNPNLATHTIHTQAIVTAGAGKFINALMTRFDSMSDSLSALFTTYSHRVTFLLSLLVALALPLDTIDLMQRLSSDDKLKDTLVTEAIKESNAQNQIDKSNSTDTNPVPQKQGSGQTSPAPIASSTNSTTPLDDIDFTAINNAYDRLNNPQLSIISHGGWKHILNFDQPSLSYYMEFLFGCFLSALLLSIGAPFWFEALKNLINLRSSLAKTDDLGREYRSNDQTTPETKPENQSTTK